MRTDFTSSIRKALDKSSLMTMAITPNMVNENNYVIEHEYPDARRASKPILPVDTKSPDPEQDYLIGLAYLNGIDVEVDKKRAADLIIGAAEAGLPEAMERLGDLPAAAGTYTRLTEVSGEFAGRYGSMGLLSCLRFGYERMEYVATRENRPDEGESYCLRGLELSEQMYEKASSLLAQDLCCKSCCHLAAILAEEGEPRQAVEHYEKALRMAEELHLQEESNREYEDEMAKNALQIGLLAQWDPALRKDMLIQAYDVWTRLSERCPEAPEYARQRGRVRAELDRLAGSGNNH